MVVNILMASGLTVFLLAVLDVMLSSAQKKAISDWTINAWNVLDGTRRAYWDKPLVKRIVGWSTIYVVVGLAAFIVLRAIADVHGYMLLFRWLSGSDSTQFMDIFWSGLYFMKFLLLIPVVVLSPIWLLYVALGVLAVIELVMRRLAEHPKGPIIAVSLAVSSIAAIIKSLN